MLGSTTVSAIFSITGKLYESGGVRKIISLWLLAGEIDADSLGVGLEGGVHGIISICIAARSSLHILLLLLLPRRDCWVYSDMLLFIVFGLK